MLTAESKWSATVLTRHDSKWAAPRRDAGNHCNQPAAHLEQQLDHLLHDGQHATVMHANAALQHGQRVHDLHRTPSAHACHHAAQFLYAGYANAFKRCTHAAARRSKLGTLPKSLGMGRAQTLKLLLT
jgi:hypothetical protein